MKKFLLFLFFATACYAQPNINNQYVLGECSSSNLAVFNITDANSYILNGLPPQDYSITFHTSLAAANNNTAAIANPTAYLAAEPVTSIYGRVTTISNPSSYAIAYIDLVVFNKPIINPIANLNINDNDGNLDGSTIVNLTSFNPTITNGEPLTVNFYTSLESAQSNNTITNSQSFVATTQTLYVKVVNTNSCTSDPYPLNIIVNSTLNIGTPNNIIICTPGGQNLSSVDLSQNNGDLLYGLVAVNYSVTYYNTSSDAEAGINAIADPQNYITAADQQTVYARVTENANTANFKTAGFDVISGSIPIAGTLTTIFESDTDSNPDDAQTIVSLTEKEPEILLNNTGNFIIQYYTNQVDANTNSNAVINSASYSVSTGQIIYYRIENSLAGCFAVGSFKIVISTFSIGTPNNLIICVPMGESVGAFDLTLNDDVLLNGLNPADYTIEYASAPANDLEFIPISNPSQYTNIISAQGIVARVTKNNNPNNYKLSVSFTLNVGPIPIINSISDISIIDENGDGIEAVDLTLTTAEILGNQPPEVNTITFYTTAAEANAGVSPIADPQEFLTSTETIFFRIERMEGCYSTGSFYVTVLSIPAPTGETDQTFEPGDTLADIEVDGENILWYDTDGTVTGPPTGMGTPLPLTTVLEDGKTYYASQTVGGYESQERLPVTVHILLGIDSNTLSGLQYYPNPVKNTVTFSNTSNIDTIAIVNITGQRVISKSIDNTTAQIDLTGLSEGIYFAKITSDGKTRTVKIIKE
jgi:hypothetical protein